MIKANLLSTTSLVARSLTIRSDVERHDKGDEKLNGVEGDEVDDIGLVDTEKRGREVRAMMIVTME